MTHVISRGQPLEPGYLNNLRVAIRGWGVVSGLAVSQRGAGANMSVDVAAGHAYVNGVSVWKSAVTNVVVTAAHATYDRYDFVVINSSGTISVIAGTAAATSYAPDYDFETNLAILLAEIYVPATDTAIEDAQITDKRVYTYQEPPGVVQAYAGSSAPTGWVLCNGAAISRTTYGALFAVISTTYGVGDGSTTFNVPDFLGRTIIGAGAGSGLTTRARGDKSGTETHQLTVAELAAHTHTCVNSGGAHQVEWLNNEAMTAGVSGSTGGDQPHNNMPPFGVANYIIKI